MRKQKQSVKILHSTSKSIPVRDFIYLCIILTITMIAIIAMTLSDSSRAGENLNFAATAVSIVLAILAIVITLTDSTGQKENIHRLEDVANVMDEAVGKTQHLLQKTFDKSEEHIKTLITLKDDLKKHYEESINQLKSNLYSVIEDKTGNISKADLDSIIEKSLNETREKLKENNTIVDMYTNEDIARYITDAINDFPYEYLNKEDVMKIIEDTYFSLGYLNKGEVKIHANKMFNHLIKINELWLVNDNKYSTMPF